MNKDPVRDRSYLHVFDAQKLALREKTILLGVHRKTSKLCSQIKITNII